MINYTSQKLVKALGLIALGGLSGLSSFAQAPASFNWSQAGPVYNAGRSRNMIVDIRDANKNTLYTGSASSGLYKSIDGGGEWASINNNSDIRNISYVAQAVDNVIYVATGEGFLRTGQKAKAQVGTGLYKLNGDDSTYTQVASSAVVGTVINRIACHPTNAAVIALATNQGIMISTNSGQSFNQVQGLVSGPLVSGQDVEFDSNGILYCSIGSEISNNVASKVYKSNDNSTYQSFSDKTPTSGVLANSNYGRIELAVAPSNNNVIYASIAGKATSPVAASASLKGLFVSYDGGTTWGLILQGSAQLDPLTNGANTSSGDYAHSIIVSPGNPNQIFIGGYLFYMFIRTGGIDSNPVGTWINIGTPYVPNIPYYLHENIHDIKIVNSSTGIKFYFVTDAGIYRSTDLANANVISAPSFQPFYKKLVTGQFNSVGIESFPTSANSSTAVSGEEIVANDGFIGGTGGNGLTYFSGNYPFASQENNYLSGEVYNAEYSKILPNAVFATTGKDDDGTLYRSSDIRTSAPIQLQVNSYTGVLSQITPIPSGFLNNANTTSGTIFRLWENHGQIANTPDSLVFYNDSIRVQASIQGLATLTTQTTFTFSPGRPGRVALIDSIAIRTGTVIYDANNTKLPNPPFLGADKKDIFIKLLNNYAVNSATYVPTIASMVGPVSAAGVTLNATTGLDNISVTFNSAPFASKTTSAYTGTPDPAVFYKVFATVFYKYKALDTIKLTDNSISTRPVKYEIILQKPLRWSINTPNSAKPVAEPTNPLQKVATKMSARLAMAYNGGGTGNQTAIVVSKSPLSLNDPLSFVRVSANSALTTDANGVPTSSVIQVSSIGSFSVTLIEWSKSGTELYYVTHENKLFRVSNIFTIMDNTPGSYSGKLSTDIFKYNSALPSNPFGSTTINPNSPYRTTLLGTFTKPITSISIDNSDTAMAVTFNDPTGNIVMYSGKNIRKCDFSNINFTSKNGSGLSNLVTYCSMMEKNDSKKVFIGTDKGIFYTQNITTSSPVWTSINNNQLPKVQVFDIKQQVMDRWDCYNSGQIFAATNGRGVWTNKSYFESTVVSIKDLEKPKAENNLSIYPNPTNGAVFVSFSSVSGESVSLKVMDINGRVVKSEFMGKLYQGQATFTFDTGDLSSGIYIVNISSDSNVKRVAKLIVTK